MGGRAGDGGGLSRVRSIADDMFRPFRRYADFRGRASRREYWLFILFSWIVFGGIWGTGIALGWQPFDAVGKLRIVPEADAGGVDTAIFAALMLALAIFLLPTLAVQVRRFHDRDMSAWNLLWHLIPYIGELTIFWAMVRAGTLGPNRYGRDPTDPLDEWGFMLDPQRDPADRWR